MPGLVHIHVFPDYPLSGLGAVTPSNGTPGTWVFVSKHHSPLRGTRAPRTSGLFQGCSGLVSPVLRQTNTWMRRTEDTASFCNGILAQNAWPHQL